MCPSVTALLAQLTSLELSTRYREEDQPHTYALALICTPQSISHTLTRYSTSDELTDQLVSLLQKHTPSLQQLQVRALSLRTDHSGSTWGVKQLRFKGWESESSQLRDFGFMPASTAGQVEVAGVERLRVDCTHMVRFSSTLACCLLPRGCNVQGLVSVVYSMHSIWSQEQALAKPGRAQVCAHVCFCA